LSFSSLFYSTRAKVSISNFSNFKPQKSKYLIIGKVSGGNVASGAFEAKVLTGKLLTGQVFARNFLTARNLFRFFQSVQF
jgi:hypothetical protein